MIVLQVIQTLICGILCGSSIADYYFLILKISHLIYIFQECICLKVFPLFLILEKKKKSHIVRYRLNKKCNVWI